MSSNNQRTQIKTKNSKNIANESGKKANWVYILIGIIGIVAILITVIAVFINQDEKSSEPEFDCDDIECITCPDGTKAPGLNECEVQTLH